MSKEQILSSDGLPLEVSLKKAERKNKLKALATSRHHYFYLF
jgi:putative spermidine/putrescine transport system permease protein